MNIRLYLRSVMRKRDEQKEQAIRDHALEMIVTHGFDGLSMQKLAKAAGVSPSTIYIYFKDREDLLLQLFITHARTMTDATLKNFDPASSFSEGLKVQWMNRANYCMKNPKVMQFLEQSRHSPLYEKAIHHMDPRFKESMKLFVANAIERGELVKVPVEIYWSVAFAPLYNLVKFHLEGRSVAGSTFQLTNKLMLDTLNLVLKALKP